MSDPCSLTLDWGGEGPDPGSGDQLRSEAGSWYLILDAHRVQHRSTLPAGTSSRWRLRCVRLSDRDIDPAGRIIPFCWHPRRRRV